MFRVKIVVVGNEPDGKLADAEIHFAEGLLSGLKLIGFAIWRRRGSKPGEYNVTFPARQYSINGERRSFALLRPVADHDAQYAVREEIISAYREFVDSCAVKLPGEIGQ